MSQEPRRQNINDLISRKNVTTIPKDQQALLKNDHSWAVDQKNHPNGLANIPESVLQSVRVAYRLNSLKRKLPAINGHQQESAKRNTGENCLHRLDILRSSPPPQESPNTNTAQNGLRRPDVPKSSPPPSSPEEKVTWPHSETDPDENRQTHLQSSIVNETPRAHSMSIPPQRTTEEDRAQTPSVSSVLPALEHESQHETHSELNPESAFPRPRLPALEYNFSSSLPEDLEIQLPQAQPPAQAHPRVNVLSDSTSSGVRPSLMSTSQLNTPPCAQPSQPVIPSTEVTETSLPIKKRPRMKPMDLDSFEKAVVAQRVKSTSRMASTKIPEANSSDSDLSSPVIPASLRHPVDPGPLRVKETQVDFQMEDEQVPQEALSAEGPEVQDRSQAVSPITHGHLAPYELFCKKYPSYTTDHNGSEWSFVRACVCLDFMRKRSSLHEYLWDEFIRSFSAGYSGYVEYASRPVPALEWFSNLRGAPVFDKLVVKQENLDLFLTSYPELIGEARGIIRPNDKSPVAKPEPSRPAKFALDGSADNHQPSTHKSGPPIAQSSSTRSRAQSTPSTQGIIKNKSASRHISLGTTPTGVFRPRLPSKELDTPQVTSSLPKAKPTGRHSLAVNASTNRLPRDKIPHAPLPRVKPTPAKSSLGTPRWSSLGQHLKKPVPNPTKVKEYEEKRRKLQEDMMRRKSTGSTGTPGIARSTAGSDHL